MFRVVSATLPAGVPGAIGQEDGEVVLLLDGRQMDDMPWEQRISICNELLAADLGGGARLGPVIIERARAACENAQLIRLNAGRARARAAELRSA